MSETIAQECERLKFELIQKQEELTKQTELHGFASARADDYARQLLEREDQLKAAQVEFDTQAKEREYLGELLTAAVEALRHPGSLGANLTIPKMEQAAEMLDPNNKRASFNLVDFVVKPGLIESRTRATKHWALKVFADSFHDSLCDAPNYLETRFTTAKGPLVVTIKRELGYTPNEMQQYAEKKLEALRVGITWVMTALHEGLVGPGAAMQKVDSLINASRKPLPKKEEPTDDQARAGENQENA